MMKKNKIAAGVFLVLTLLNLLFPPFISEREVRFNPTDSGIQTSRDFFVFIFTDKPIDKYGGIIDIRTLIILIIISLVISFMIQGIYNIVKKKKSIINENNLKKRTC